MKKHAIELLLGTLFEKRMFVYELKQKGKAHGDGQRQAWGVLMETHCLRTAGGEPFLTF